MSRRRAFCVSMLADIIVSRMRPTVLARISSFTSISFSADFKYREFTEEITTANPDAKSGNFYDKFTWGGSMKGHAEAWIDLKVKVDGRERSYFYLYTTTSDADNVAVIEYGTVSPSKWLLKAIEQAVWTEGE